MKEEIQYPECLIVFIGNEQCGYKVIIKNKLNYNEKENFYERYTESYSLPCQTNNVLIEKGIVT